MKASKKLLCLILTVIMCLSTFSCIGTVFALDRNLDRPSKVTASQTYNKVTIKWKKVSGADGYAVYQKDGSKKELLGYTEDCNYTVKKLSPGTKYTFYVRAYSVSRNDKELALKYGAVTFYTKAAPVSKISVKETSTSITVSWDKSKGASGYRIYKKVDGEWKVVTNTKNTSYTFKVKQAGTKLEIGIKPYVRMENQREVLWSENTAFTVANTPSAPKVSVTAIGGGAELKWSKVKNADGYKILYKKHGTSKWLDAGKTKSTSYTIDSLKENSYYDFAVRAYIKTSTGTYQSTYKTVTVKTLEVPKFTVPKTKTECVDAFNEVVYDVRTSDTRVKVSCTEDMSVTVNDISGGSAVDDILYEYLTAAFSGESSEDSYSFKNGKAAGKTFPVFAKGNALSENDVKSATAKKKGDGYEITLVLKKETVKEDDEGSDRSGKVIDADGATQFLKSDDLGVTQSTVVYQKTVIKATMDSEGRLIELHIEMPFDIKAQGDITTGAGGAPYSFDMECYTEQTLKIDY